MIDGPWRFSLLGYPVGFARPAYLLALVGVALLGIWAVVRALRRRARVAAVVGSRGAEKLAPGISRGRPAAQASLSTLGLACWALALAQPQCGSRTEWVKRTGVDVVVALDASKSMLARDVVPSRLERAKLELTAWLQELKGDRVGLVVFSGDAFVQCPLTTDYAAAAMFLRAVDPEQMQQGGTDIEGALNLSLQVLQRSEREGPAPDRVVVLLSDGEDTQGEAIQAAERLGEAGVRVLAVGIGSETGEPVPELNRRGEVEGYKRDASGNPVLSRLDRAGLARVAESSGGELFHKPRGVALKDVLARIDRLQKGEVEGRLTVQYDERFQPFVGTGLALCLAAALVRTSKRRAS
ncbi:MAG TPA: VWA domain-containing protein [Myxococcaceae bacterium]|nr:VWA domain-containing protein [Myxococcaceae bacterium]